MRPSDLEDADLHATEHGLIAAADEGRIVCEPAGSDAIWRPRHSRRSPRSWFSVVRLTRFAFFGFGFFAEPLVLCSLARLGPREQAAGDRRWAQ